MLSEGLFFLSRMISLWTIIAIIPLFLILWNIYIRSSKFHVLLRKIPGPSPIPLIGNALELFGGCDSKY